MHRKHLTAISATLPNFTLVSSFRPLCFYTPEVLESKLAPLLEVCTSSSNTNSGSILKQVQHVHAQVTVNGLHNMGILGTRILGLYVLSKNYTHAKYLFYQLNLRYASPWNWLIRGFTMVGCFDYALLFYFKMLSYGTSPDKYTFPYVIKACSGSKAIGLGKCIHGMIRDFGFELDVFVGSALIKFYAEQGCLDNARRLFDRMPHRDGVLWNVMMNAYVKNEDCVDDVIGLFREMRDGGNKPNSITFACVLSVCGAEGIVALGSQVHGLVIKCGLEMGSTVANTLVTMYAKCRRLFDARRLFDSMEKDDLVAWNGMIGGCVQNGLMSEAFDLFREMINAGERPDSITLASLLPSVTDVGSIYHGKEIHGYIIRHGVEMDVFLKNALIDTYFKCRNVKMACKVFNYNSAVDVVIYTAMISGYVLNGMNAEALETFRRLLAMKMRPNAVTIASVLPACAGLAALQLGRELHGSILRRGLEQRCYVGSAIMDMYAKCGRLNLALQVFGMLTAKDVVCWNSIITSCCQNAKPEEAIELFCQMGAEGAKYDCVSISAALSACACLPAFHYGRAIHGFMMRSSFNSDLFAESALIDMYAKCGNLDLARRVFDTMACKNEVSWNSIIASYGNHGLLEESLGLLHEMKEDGFQPDHVTFLAIISACGHAGKVEEGKHYFNCMIQEYGISARMEHYACIVDLLGRAGRLEEAFQTIKSMPFSPDAGIWGTLLGACRVHGNVELAEMASEYLFQMDPQNSGYYVLLSNLQAGAGKWEGVHRTRSIMRARGVQKVPGYSWVEVNNATHMFVAADTNHPQSAEIYSVLKNLLLELEEEGYGTQAYLPEQAQAVPL